MLPWFGSAVTGCRYRVGGGFMLEWFGSLHCTCHRSPLQSRARCLRAIRWWGEAPDEPSVWDGARGRSPHRRQFASAKG